MDRLAENSDPDKLETNTGEQSLFLGLNLSPIFSNAQKEQMKAPLKSAQDVVDGWGKVELNDSRQGPYQPARMQATTAEINKMIEKLGDDKFEVRLNAKRDLQSAGAQALPQLIKAINSPDFEISQTAGSLVASSKESRLLSINEAPTNSDLCWGSDYERAVKTLVDTYEQFAANPQLAKERIQEISALVGAGKNGQLPMTPEEVARLEKEALAMADIKTEAAKMRVSYARCFAAGDSENMLSAVKENLHKAMQHDPRVVEDPHFFELITSCGLHKDEKFMSTFEADSRFMDSYRKAGGSERKLERIISEELKRHETTPYS